MGSTAVELKDRSVWTQYVAYVVALGLAVYVLLVALHGVLGVDLLKLLALVDKLAKKFS